MSCPYGNTVLITGASSGIGRAAALFLAERGFHVYGASRRGGERAETGDGFISMHRMDVTDDESVKNGIAEILSEAGHIDVLISCAGIGLAGAVEDCDAESARLQMDTNYFGILRVLNHVLPVMRAQKNGLIVNIGSVAGIYSIPFQTLYSSAKFAVEALTEGLRMELKGTGVNACLVEPGDTKTGFTACRRFPAAAAHTAYEDTLLRAVGKMVSDEQNGVDPDKVVHVIYSMMQKKRPPIRKCVGFSYKAMVFMKRILPAGVMLTILGDMYTKAKKPSPDVFSMDIVRENIRS